MNKEQFVTILQSALFYFDGATEKEILSFNLYDPKLIKVGIKLCNYLNALEVKE